MSETGPGYIPLDKAYLTAIWLETLFYGINFLLFWSYMWISRYRHRNNKVNKVILPIGILMFCFSTIHVSLGFERLLQGFIYLRDQPGGPAAFFSNVSIPANVAKVTIHTVNSVLGDSIVVWRCYHVWGQSWAICVVPVMLIIASAVGGFGQAVVFATATTTHTAFAHRLAIWNGMLFGLSLATNVVVTSLIAARIWYLGRELPFDPSFRYRRVLAMIVESGAIYSSAIIIEITLYFLNSNAFYIIYDPIAQLTAIVPTTIIVMAVLGLTSSDLNEKQRMTIETTPRFASKPAAQRRGQQTTTLGVGSFEAAQNPEASMGTMDFLATANTDKSVFVDIKTGSDSYELTSSTGGRSQEGTVHKSHQSGEAI
ncbi:hypothetical protein CYLTODRAFT_403470 [Cylindrobasidium torrendii FP15055 ss-10]|uniref:Uncharacterized protein n=1 Tax=Cylindrobasidium torrendii FP15055 ss-10 TaxID=1314674 RepID=A0A0D7B1B8_9AGAR|nr:hypothetical protein CYLTODRAFT_403470 [Cylindrobasidium torrendii FP15055 ss-10]